MCMFKTHKDPLEYKCRILHSAFTSEFAEGQDGEYTFSDTTDGTLARFVEWAYLGDYQASVISKDVELDNHPQLTHLQL